MKYIALTWKEGEKEFANKAMVTANSKSEARNKMLDFINQYRTTHPEAVMLDPESVRMEILTPEEFIKTQPVTLRPRLRAELKDIIEEIGDDIYVPFLDPNLRERRWYARHTV